MADNFGEPPKIDFQRKLHSKGGDGTASNDGPSNQPTDKTTTDANAALSKEGNTTAKPDAPVATGGAVRSTDSSQAKPKEGVSISPASNPEVKSAPADSKPVAASQAAASSADKTQAPGKPQAEQIRTESPASKEHLVASNPYPQSKIDISTQQAKPDANKLPGPHIQENQPGTSAQVLVQPGRSTTDNQQAKANTTPSDKPNAPIGGVEREHKDSQAPPAQAVKSQENSYQPSKTSSDAKPEINKIPAVPIPIENQSQKNQNPTSAAQKPETAPVKPQQDLVAKPPDAKSLPADTQKQNVNDGKSASEAGQHKKLDEPPKSPTAGELGSNNSAGKEGKLVPEPNTTTDANVRGGTSNHSDIAPEATTKEASISKIDPHSQIKAVDNEVISNRIDAIFEKDKDHQNDSAILPPVRKDGKESVISPSDASRDLKIDNQSVKDKNADITNKTEARQPGNEVSSGSVGAGFDGRPGRVSDKSEPKAEAIERGELFKMLDGKPVKLDLSDKATCKQLLDLINQIETNKFKQLDQVGQDRRNLLLEIKPESLKQLKELLGVAASKDIPVDSRAVLLLQDKLDASIAERSKQQVNKILELENSNNGFKQIVTRVGEALEHFLKAWSAPKKEPEKEIPDAHGLVLALSDNADSMPPEVREFVINLKEVLPKNINVLEVVSEEKPESVDDVPVTTTSPKVNLAGHSREAYLIQDKDTPHSIALKCFNNELLAQLIWEINKPEAAYSASSDKISNRDFLAGDLIYLPTYRERQKFLEPQGASHEES